jgi:hypothetical protein
MARIKQVYIRMPGDWIPAFKLAATYHGQKKDQSGSRYLRSLLLADPDFQRACRNLGIKALSEPHTDPRQEIWLPVDATDLGEAPQLYLFGRPRPGAQRRLG